MRRRQFLFAVAGGAAYPLASIAQQQDAKIRRVGILWASAPSLSTHRFEAFRAAMRELGYIDGQNVHFEQRGPDRILTNNELATLAKELIDQHVEVLLTAGTNPTRAAQVAGKSLPIVMTFVSDPIGSKFIDGLAHPGRTITGLTNFGPEVSVKWLELLKDMVPGVERVAVLYDPAVRVMVSGMQNAARTTAIELATSELRNDERLEEYLADFANKKIQALIVTLPARTASQQKRLLQFASENRIPALYWWREYVDAGGLIYYGPDVTDMYRRAAAYVDKLLKGTSPAELPVEQPTRLSLVINLAAAKKLGLVIAPTLLARADEVIE
jgi:putative ABC transport system substrate-binding protein